MCAPPVPKIGHCPEGRCPNKKLPRAGFTNLTHTRPGPLDRGKLLCGETRNPARGSPLFQMPKRNGHVGPCWKGGKLAVLPKSRQPMRLRALAGRENIENCHSCIFSRYHGGSVRPSRDVGQPQRQIHAECLGPQSPGVVDHNNRCTWTLALRQRPWIQCCSMCSSVPFAFARKGTSIPLPRLGAVALRTLLLHLVVASFHRTVSVASFAWVPFAVAHPAPRGAYHSILSGPRRFAPVSYSWVRFSGRLSSGHCWSRWWWWWVRCWCSSSTACPW